MTEAAAPRSPALSPPRFEPRDAQEAALAGAGRWEDLVGLLVERTASYPDPSRRAAELRRAAALYEGSLGDAERALIALEAAFAEDRRDDEISGEIERITTTLGRWRETIDAHEQAVAEVQELEQRAALLLTLARWRARYLGDERGADERLSAALGLQPGNPLIVRAAAGRWAAAGEWARAASQLLDGAQAAGDPTARATLLSEAAEIFHRRLRQPQRAAEIYAHVLELDPRNREAARAMAEASGAAQDWPGARYALSLVAGAEELDPAERAAAHHRLATIAVRAGDNATARDEFRLAAALDASPDLLREWAEAAWAQRWWDDLRAGLEPLLDRHRDRLSPSTRLDLLARLGEALVALDQPHAAVERLESVVAAAPDHAGCREALVRAHGRLGEAAAALHHQRALLGLGGEDDRFVRLVEIGRRQRDELKDLTAALASFEEARALRPDDRALLAETLDLLTGLKQWKKAVAVLLQLAEQETTAARGPYLVAAANILNYELHAPDEAIELYERVLDDDPTDLKTFERIDKIHTTKRAWRDEARAYRRMIKRVGPEPDGTNTPTLQALWRGLGEIYRTRLLDVPAATAAFEVCASLTPDDLTIHEILAEIAEGQGAQGAPKAIERRTFLVSRAQTPAEMARQLKALRALYVDQGRLDRAFAVCAALTTLGHADAKERSFYETHAAARPAWPRAALTEDLWRRQVYDPGEERHLSLALALIGPAMALVRGKDARAAGLKEKLRVADPERDPSPIVRAFAFAGQMLGVPRPTLYVQREAAVEIDVVNVVEQGQPVPAMIVNPELLSRRGDREVAFLFGRALALLRLDHLVVWPGVTTGPHEVELALLAAVKLFHPALALPTEQQAAFQQYLALFKRTLPPQAMEPLLGVVPWLVERVGRLDVAGWRAGVGRTACRAGLLVCGDVGVATRVAREGTTGGADALVRDLLSYGVSESYLSLREQLGVTIVPDAEPRPPVQMTGASPLR